LQLDAVLDTHTTLQLISATFGHDFKTLNTKIAYSFLGGGGQTLHGALHCMFISYKLYFITVFVFTHFDTAFLVREYPAAVTQFCACFS
jgi:hypothetical protein